MTSSDDNTLLDEIFKIIENSPSYSMTCEENLSSELVLPSLEVFANSLQINAGQCGKSITGVIFIIKFIIYNKIFLRRP